ncbi:ATP-dependent DNA helicase [Chryseobacterium sp. AG363]|uniref:ATP-dependent DNA helicase n=1 Tax=Chryseobacterium sp. AG363 TaxID=2183997 RepID=UPI000E71BC1D|nr:ATP-dependent DNA helicase [Chryseobacterium sp. AG363]RKE77861.1 DNA helicase-2/ATP-dependent DNA helicase PcrA [Chryseobacterium sp. AG363]
MINLQDFSPSQKEAILINDKHLRIIACAGSGKTTTVAGKVAYLLDPENNFNIKPENIIAFTYTEKAAGELKNKILNNVGQYRGMANMYIGTIHGWCLKSLQENEYRYQSFSVLDDIKLKLFVDKHYDLVGMKNVTKLSNPSVSLRRFIDTSLFIRIMDIVRESDIKKGLKFPENILQAKKKYEETLISKKYFDFSMIMDKALECLDNDTNLKNIIKNNLKYLIVDEYQDVNPLQEKLIKRLQEISDCKLIVVGDDDQNIYQWRGSNNKYIINFEDNFNKDSVKTIPLSLNYRSSEGITKLSETLISNNQKRIPDKKMDSYKSQNFDRGIDILYNRYDNVENENEAIAKYINDIIGVKFEDNDEETRGIAFSDISILLRTWSKANSIVSALEKYNIPYITAGVNQLFEMDEIKAALAIFNYLYGDIDEYQLKEKWLKIPHAKISPEKIDVAIFNLSMKNPNIEKVKDNWEYSLQDIFWNFLNDSEVYEENFINQSNEDIELRSKERAEIIFFNLGKFSQVINDFETINFNSTSPSFHLFSFLSFINYVAKDYYPEGWLNNPYKTPNAVQIMTIHQSKGLEFPCVIVPGLNHNYLPSKKRGGLNEWHFLDRELIDEQSRYEGDEEKEDERRLLYVALTRSQKFLLLTQAPDLNNKLYKKESQFIQELTEAKINSFPVMITDLRHRFSDNIKIQSKPKEKVKNISLDFTSLKDIFECPYRFKLISVFGFCYPLNQRMGVGKSFHNCLMEIHKEAKKGVILQENELISLIDRQTHFPYLTKSTKLSQPLYDKVKNNVKDYYRDNLNEFENIEFVEQEIQYKIDKNILVIGRIDLIKKIGDSGYYETTIVEFKSDEENADAPLTKDQLKLYALGHRELTGETANYIMTYVIGKNRAKTPEKLYENDLEEIQQKIKNAVGLIRDEKFIKTNESRICNENCYQIRLCSNRIKYNIKPKR